MHVVLSSQISLGRILHMRMSYDMCIRVFHILLFLELETAIFRIAVPWAKE